MDKDALDLSTKSLFEYCVPVEECVEQFYRVENHYPLQVNVNLREDASDYYTIAYPYTVPAYLAMFPEKLQNGVPLNDKDFESIAYNRNIWQQSIDYRIKPILQNKIPRAIVHQIDENADFGVILNTRTGALKLFEYHKLLDIQQTVVPISVVYGLMAKSYENSMITPEAQSALSFLQNNMGKFQYWWNLVYQDDNGDQFNSNMDGVHITEMMPMTPEQGNTAYEYVTAAFKAHVKVITYT